MVRHECSGLHVESGFERGLEGGLNRHSCMGAPPTAVVAGVLSRCGADEAIERVNTVEVLPPKRHLCQASVSKMCGTASSTVSITLISYSIHCV